MKNKDTFIYNTFNWNIQIPKDDKCMYLCNEVYDFKFCAF